MCRTLKAVGRSIVSLYAPLCPFCGRRGFHVVQAINEEWEEIHLSPEETIGRCTYCERFGTITGDEIECEPEVDFD